MKAIEIAERRNRIVEIVREKKIFHMAEAMQLFDMSNETIRKDFVYLEEIGVVKKIHGGIQLLESDSTENIHMREMEHFAEKNSIVKKAMEFIPDRPCTIGLDTGSTIKLLAAMLAGQTGKTIITNSLQALLQLINSNNEVYCTGGKWCALDMCFQGNIATNAFTDLGMDICFLGSSGVFNHHGICSANFQDLEVKRQLISRSAKRVVLLDSSKFLLSSFVEVAKWEELTCVITDDRIPNEIRKRLSKRVELITVPSQ